MEHSRLERELVIFVKADYYDDVRTCCQGPKICPKCWPLLAVAARVLTTVLRSDYGFEDVLFVYSGRRGLHAWVCDAAARALDDEQRAAMLNHLTARLPGLFQRDRPSISRTAAALTTPLHPTLASVYGALESAFERAIIPETGQRLLAAPENWVRILNAIPEMPEGVLDLRAAVSVCWQLLWCCNHARRHMYASTPTPLPYCPRRMRRMRGCVRQTPSRGGGSCAMPSTPPFSRPTR